MAFKATMKPLLYFVDSEVKFLD